MSSKIKTLNIYDKTFPNGDRGVLKVEIDEHSDLILEGFDIGSGVEKRFGKEDVEYKLKIPSEYKDTVLLHLIKDKFQSSHDLETWLNSISVPSKRDLF